MPILEITDRVYVSDARAKEEFFFGKIIDANEVLSLPNPSDITSNPDYLQRLGIYLTPIARASSSPFVVETYYVCHGLDTANPVVVRGCVTYKSQNENGLYLVIGYNPISYADEDGLNPVFLDDPVMFSDAVSIRMGSEVEKRYLDYIKKQPKYHRVPNAFGSMSHE